MLQNILGGLNCYNIVKIRSWYNMRASGVNAAILHVIGKMEQNKCVQ